MAGRSGRHDGLARDRGQRAQHVSRHAAQRVVGRPPDAHHPHERGRPTAGLRVVAWTRRTDGQWLRWQSAPFISQSAWQAAWESANVWSQVGTEQTGTPNGPQAVRVANASEWQLHYFRNNAWTNPLSSGAESGTAVDLLPDGIRLMITLAPGQAINGPMVIDWVRPNFGGTSQ